MTRQKDYISMPKKTNERRERTKKRQQMTQKTIEVNVELIKAFIEQGLLSMSLIDDNEKVVIEGTEPIILTIERYNT